MTTLTGTSSTEHLILLLSGGGADIEPVRSLLEQLSNQNNQHTLRFVEEQSDLEYTDLNYASNHCVVIVSNSSKTHDEQYVTDIAKWSLDRFFSVFLICDTGAGPPFEHQAPEILRPINGICYKDEWQLRAAVTRVLNLIGFDERDRRAFISYRRTDTTPLANDLRHALIDRGWNVFLDSFSIDPGQNFQEQLMRDLDDRSFVIVLESPNIRESEWVGKEIAFAKGQGIGFLGLRLPKTPKVALIDEIDDDRRIQLVHRRFEERADRQPPVGLVELMEQVQRAHTSAFRARRESMLENIETTLLRDHYRVERIDEWALAGTRNGARRLVALATPRTPQPADLLFANRLRGRRGMRQGCDAWVLHPLVDPEPNTFELLKWVRNARAIRVCSVKAFQKEILR